MPNITEIRADELDLPHLWLTAEVTGISPSGVTEYIVMGQIMRIKLPTSSETAPITVLIGPLHNAEYVRLQPDSIVRLLDAPDPTPPTSNVLHFSGPKGAA